VVVFETCLSHTAPCHTYSTSQKLFLSHPWPYTSNTSAVSQTG